MKARFQPKVSVVIPTFNRPELLTRAITSVLSQTERDLEVVVVDDASRDDMQAVVRSIGDDRIAYYRNATNLGEAGSRNVGVERARGAYVGFLDDDDEWLPEKLHHQLKVLRGVDRPAWAFCGWEWVDTAHGTAARRRIPDARGRVEGLPRWAHNVAVDFVARRELLQKMPFDPTLGYYIPCDLLIRLSMTAQATAVPEVLVTCYTHGGPRLSTKKAEVKIRDIETLLARYGRFMKSDPRGWARFNLILGALYSREIRDGRRARGPLKEAIRARPTQWRSWAYLLHSAIVPADPA
jgi:glycosyltransferase involved in cell wall biosynthesis